MTTTKSERLEAVKAAKGDVFRAAADMARAFAKQTESMTGPEALEALAQELEKLAKLAGR